MTEYAPQWTSWISIFFASLTLGIVLWNFKGGKTLVAGGLILAGLFLIVRSELYSGILSTYYQGCALLLAGVWLNGSFLYFVRQIQGNSDRLIPSWPK